VTGYSNVEEEMAGVRDIMPFSLEDALGKTSGGKYTKGEKPYNVHVVVGRGAKLINGQNPNSAGLTGTAILKQILKEEVERA
jgi:putative intracellular protease/amidase